MNLGTRKLFRVGSIPSGKRNVVVRMLRDAGGVAAIEFAMILPVMLILLLGLVEVSNTVNYDRRISRIANAITDLVAQTSTVTRTELDGVLDLGGTILAPYPADDLDIIVASVTFDDESKPSVDWSYNSDGGEPWSPGSPPPITLPPTIALANTSIVVSQANLTYVPPFAGVFTNYFERASSFELSDTFYLRPRITTTVTCSNC